MSSVSALPTTATYYIQHANGMQHLTTTPDGRRTTVAPLIRYANAPEALYLPFQWTITKTAGNEHLIQQACNKSFLVAEGYPEDILPWAVRQRRPGEPYFGSPKWVIEETEFRGHLTIQPVGRRERLGLQAIATSDTISTQEMQPSLLDAEDKRVHWHFTRVPNDKNIQNQDKVHQTANMFINGSPPPSTPQPGQQSSSSFSDSSPPLPRPAYRVPAMVCPGIYAAGGPPQSPWIKKLSDLQTHAVAMKMLAEQRTRQLEQMMLQQQAANAALTTSYQAGPSSSGLGGSIIVGSSSAPSGQGDAMDTDN